MNLLHLPDILEEETLEERYVLFYSNSIGPE